MWPTRPCSRFALDRATPEIWCISRPAAAPLSGMTQLSAVRSRLNEGKFEEAFQAVSEHRFGTADAVELTWGSLVRLENGHDVDALRWAERAVRAAPADPFAHAVRGLARVNRGDLAGAWADAEVARGCEPYDVVLMAVLLNEHDQTDEAVALLSDAITRHPFDNKLRLAPRPTARSPSAAR